MLVDELLNNVSLLEISQTELEYAQRKRKNRLAEDTFEEKEVRKSKSKYFFCYTSLKNFLHIVYY